MMKRKTEHSRQTSPCRAGWLALLLGLTLSTPVWAACPPAQLLESAFSLAPDTQAGVTSLADARLAAGQRLYFLSRINGNATGSVYHRWYRNGSLLKEVRLAAVSGNWQGWSAEQMKADADGSWQVDILDGQQCLLGRASISAGPASDLQQQVDALLAKQDVTGAKLLLKEALARPATGFAERRRWQRYLERDLVLAEAEADIRQWHLVAAEGRLASLAGKLDDSLTLRYRQALQQLAAARLEADRTAAFRLLSAIRSLSLTSACPVGIEQAKTLLAPWTRGLDIEVVKWNADAGKNRLDATLPSGATRSFGWPCDGLLATP